MVDDKHAFLSYVREDSAAAELVQSTLEAVGVKVWRDRDALGPGDLWKAKIREAIQGQSLAFVALVSNASVSKERSYQRPELLLAAEEYQLHPPEAHWLFVARVDDCPLPQLDLGGGRQLTDLQWSDLFGAEQSRGLVRLAVAIRELLREDVLTTEVADVVVARTNEGGARVGDSIKALLRDPDGDIGLEDRVDEISDQVAEVLADRERFPLSAESFATTAEGVQLTNDLLLRYESAVEPLRETLTLAGTWARPSNDRTWTRAAERVADACFGEGDLGRVSSLLLGTRQYPLLLLAYATTIASIERKNFSPTRAVLIDAMGQPRDVAGPLLAFLNVQHVFEPAWIGSAIAIHQDTRRLIDDEFVRAVEFGQVPNRYTPAADLLHDRLRPYFRRQFRSDARFTEAFDRASVLMDALSMDLRAQRSVERYLPARPGFGSYTWRYQHSRTPIETVMAGEVTPDSAMLSAGLFDGSFERASAAFNALVQSVAAVRAQRF